MATDNLSIREKITSMIAEYTEYHGGDLGTPMDYSIHSILKVAEILVSKQKVQEKRLYDILTEYDAEKEKSANDIQHWRTKAAGHENKIALLEQSNRVQEEKMNELTKEKNEEIAKAWQQIESLEGKLKAKETELENVQGRWEHRENIIREERKTHRSFQKGADKAKEKMDQIWETYRSKFRYAWEMNMEQLELAGQVDPSHGIAAGPHKQAQMSPSSKRDVRKRKESNESKSPCPEESEDRKQRSPETMSKLPKMLKSSAEGVIADFCIASTAGMDASPDIKVPPQEHPQQEDVQMEPMALVSSSREVPSSLSTISIGQVNRIMNPEEAGSPQYVPMTRSNSNRAGQKQPHQHPLKQTHKLRDNPRGAYRK